MYVKNLMMPLKDLITVTPDHNIKAALQTIKEKHLLSIPVAVGTKFYGTISKDRIYEFYYEECLDKSCLLTDFTVQDVMRTDIPIVRPYERIENAAYFLEVSNIPFVAVLDDNDEFLGIVTHNAIFHQFTELFGIDKGKRIAVIAYDIPGQISKLSKIICENDANILSLVVADPKSITEIKEIIIRVQTNNYDELVEKIKEYGFKIHD